MKFFLKYQLLFVLVLFAISCVEFATGDEEDYDDNEDLSRTFLNRPRDVRACRYRRRMGVCKKRSECKRATRHVCQFGADPIICCMDRDETTTTTTTTTRTPPRLRPRPEKPDEVQNIDLTYPGCGLRSPNVPEDNRRNEPKERAITSRRGGLSRLGKRDLTSYLRHKRFRRFISPVIVGGVEAKSNSWPWMAAMFRQTVPTNDKTRRFMCGASLISKNYVITAAHCFDGESKIEASKFSVVLGSHTTKDGTEYRVQNVLIHPGYKKRQYYNDLCLLKLSKPVELTKKIYPVCVPSDGLKKKIMPTNSNVTVTGWGDTSFGGISSQVLQELTIPIVPLKQCNESYIKVAQSSVPQGITDRFICAGVSEGGKDACQGDSGGPLVTRLKDNAFVQLGVVSFGFQCARAGFPGVYTRLSKYTTWLYENTDLGKR